MCSKIQGCKSLRLTLISDFSAASGFNSYLHIKSFFFVNYFIDILKKLLDYSSSFLNYTLSVYYYYYFQLPVTSISAPSLGSNVDPSPLLFTPRSFQFQSATVSIFTRLLMELIDLDVANRLVAIWNVLC